MNDAWLIYLIATALFVGLGSWLLHRSLTKIFSIWITVIPALALLVIFITPVGVPDTSEMAPAWLVFLYESAFGEPERAQRALKPLSWSVLVATCVFLSGYLVYRLTRKRQGASANS